MAISKLNNITTVFATGNILTAEAMNSIIANLNTVIGKVNNCIDAINGQPSSSATVEFFNEDSVEGGYGETIAELYLPYNLENSSAEGFIVKHYNGRLFVRPRITASSYSWTVQIADSLLPQNGVVFPLQVTATGADGNVNVGDIVGYLIFKDVDKFKSLSTSGSLVTVVTSLVQDVTKSPTIQAYITSNS